MMGGMVTLLSIWIKQQQQYMPLNLMLIQEKATSLFHDLKQKVGESVARTFSLQVMGGSCISSLCEYAQCESEWRCGECRTRMQQPGSSWKPSRRSLKVVVICPANT